MKKNLRLSVITALLAASVACSLAACTQTSGNPNDTADDSTQGTVDTNDTGNTSTNGSADTSDTGSTGNSGTSSQSVVLTFNGTSLNTSVSDSGVTVDNNAFVITKGGSYELTGDLSNGQVRVSVAKTEEVELILNNFTASCSTSASLYIESCDKATIVLAAGSVNSLTDATMYQYATAGEDKPNACLYSSDDLTIEGKGTLTVTGNYNNGIGCKNDLKLKDATITVSAPNNIIKGNDSVEIEDVTLTLSGGEDAIKADTTDRTDKGYVLITADAKINITCSDDAIQATVSVTVEAGATVTGTAGGAAINCPGTINADTAAMQIQAAE